MTNAEPMKLKEGLLETYNLMANISVPIALLQQIGLPIMTAMENLQNMINAIDQAAEQAAGQATIGRQEPDPNEEKAIREEDL